MDTTRSVIAVLVLMILVLNLQLLYLFPSHKKDDVSDGYTRCEREVIINFNYQPRTKESRSNISPLLDKWNATDPIHGRLLALKRYSQNFLTIGIPTSKWKNGPESLLVSLSSIANETSLQQKLEIVVVVMLLDKDRAYNLQLLKALLQKYHYFVDIGFLHILEPGDHAMFNVSVTKSNNINNQALQVMSNYAMGLSKYYLQMEDDIECAPGFYHQIRHFMSSKGLEMTPWSLVEFSEMGLVGKLVKTADLHKFATFMSMFTWESEPIERTIALYRHVMLQNKQIMLKPTIFQRLDSPNIFQDDGELRKAPRDRFFDGSEKRFQGDDPEGQVITNMEVVGHNLPEFVYRGGDNFFWAKAPQIGDWLTIVFDEDVELEKVIIMTGFDTDEELTKDSIYTLRNATVEASPKLLRMDQSQNKVVCANYKKIGMVINGFTEINGISKKVYNKRTKCLTIRILEAHEDSVMFQQISVFLDM